MTEQIQGETLYGNNFTYHTAKLWESPETAELDKALVQFSAEFKAVKRDETVAVPGRAMRKFSSLDEIMIEIRPILAKAGLYVQQPISGDEIITLVKHESGQFRACSMPMVAWQGQGTTPIQNLGGAITYLRRYSLGAMLALATEEDDDGASTGKLQPGTAKATPTKQTAPPVQLTEQQQTIIDEWTSQVEQCKTPADFEKLSGELKSIKDTAVLTPIRAAMGKQMGKQGVAFTKDLGFHEAEA